MLKRMDGKAGNGAAPKKGACRALSADELMRVRAALGDTRDPVRDTAWFTVGVATGFRVSGLMSLDIADAVAGLAAGRVYLAKRANKNSKHHSVALRPEAADALRTLLAELAAEGITSGPLFRSRKGGGRLQRAQVGRILHAAYVRAGVVGTDVAGLTGTHCCRKSFAARTFRAATRRMIETGGAAGEAVELTRRALGHRSLDSTLRYLPIDVADVDAAVLG